MRYKLVLMSATESGFIILAMVINGNDFTYIYLT